MGTLIDSLDLDALPTGMHHRLLLRLAEDGLGRPVRVPLMVCRGAKPGPVFGITAAVHGDELNGIPIVHRLFAGLDASTLRGTVLACVVVNVPGLLRGQRSFDREDLNRIFPGKPDGNDAQAWAHRILNQVVAPMDSLLDLHTASRGRVNSLYVRADMDAEVPAQMARLQRPQIIVHNPPKDGTLRGAAADLGIPAITVEVGNPSRFQRDMIQTGLRGVRNVLRFMGMVGRKPQITGPDPVRCDSSYWMYTTGGGLLEVVPKLAAHVQAGEVVARQTNAFGDVTRQYVAPQDGVVIGKSVSPVAATGARILHLGVPA